MAGRRKIARRGTKVVAVAVAGKEQIHIVGVVDTSWISILYDTRFMVPWLGGLLSQSLPNYAP